MHYFKKQFLLFISLFSSVFIFAQTNIPIGTWRIHTPGRICKTIEKVGNKIYAASESSFIVYNKDDNSIKSLSKIDGFNGTKISKLKYHTATSTLIIAYTDGNIDLLNDGDITNLSDIFRANIIGPKKVNHITFKGNIAYLSCSFGIVVLDLLKLEIKETYSNIGVNGTQIEVHSAAFKGDSLFVATSNGIKVGLVQSNINLIDFNNWFSYTAASGLPSNLIFYSIGCINNVVYAINDKSVVYIFNGTEWSVDASFVFPTESKVNLVNTGGTLNFVHPSKVISLDVNAQKTEINNISSIYDIIIENSALTWLASSENGIIKIENGQSVNIAPNSPYFSSAFRLYNYVDWTGVENLVVTTGGYSANSSPIPSPYGIYIFREGLWENYNERLGNLAPSPNTENYIECEYNKNDSSLYISSFVGVVKFNRLSPNVSKSVVLNNGLIDLWGGGGAYFIFDVKFDSDNKRWLTGPQRPSSTSPTLFSYYNNVSENFAFPSLGNLQRFPVELLIDDNDNKWIRYSINNGGGIMVFNEKNPVGKQQKYLTDQIGEGKLPSMGVQCYKKGPNGDIWVGTDKGVAVYYNPNAILNSTNFDATTPIYENRPLLRDKSVKCITIDGANRKWIGTDAGVWLFSEDGTQEILHYDVDNSPLLSNNIYDIEIIKSTGEIFFATDAGIVSFRGNATDPLTVENTSESSEFSAKVFPNPVLPEFSGLIGITGLPLKTNVKITDINGVLVYETTSNGGAATWNGVTYTGNKAESGVYLVFATNPEGLQTMVSKFAIVK
jgi:hypothetical protein